MNTNNNDNCFLGIDAEAEISKRLNEEITKNYFYDIKLPKKLMVTNILNPLKIQYNSKLDELHRNTDNATYYKDNEIIFNSHNEVINDAIKLLKECRSKDFINTEYPLYDYNIYHKDFKGVFKLSNMMVYNGEIPITNQLEILRRLEYLSTHLFIHSQLKKFNIEYSEHSNNFNNVSYILHVMESSFNKKDMKDITVIFVLVKTNNIFYLLPLTQF